MHSTPDTSATGLSPRVRGNRIFTAWFVASTGSIPARAGEPSDYPDTDALDEIYPRACGGTGLVVWRLDLIRGLSPRVRGNLPVLSRCWGMAGSIPARAGEPDWRGPGPESNRVYPRACGGTICCQPRSTDRPGLSPRVRGNRQRVVVGLEPDGSIPARAGEPRAPCWPHPVCAVYPRACGGTHHEATPVLQPRGLSPRVRGNRWRDCTAVVPRRSIPARAGEPNCIRDFLSSVRVYPRACGGTVDESAHQVHLKGLSPRVRGNPLPSR